MSKQTILVVEDEKSIRGAIVDILQIENYDTLEASNGKEGVETALSKHPDLILLDLIMPEMDGMTALKNIRQDSWGANVPVIILTNLSATSEPLVEDMVRDKPLFYLVKSDWKLHDVVTKIQEVFKTQETK